MHFNSKMNKIKLFSASFSIVHEQPEPKCNIRNRSPKMQFNVTSYITAAVLRDFSRHQRVSKRLFCRVPRPIVLRIASLISAQTPRPYRRCNRYRLSNSTECCFHLVRFAKSTLLIFQMAGYSNVLNNRNHFSMKI